MSKFNRTIQVGKPDVVNHEGEPAFSMSKELELYSLVCTSLMEDNFYESGADNLKRLRSLLDSKDVDDLFVGQLAVYAREKMNLRSVPVVLSVELAKRHSGDDLVRKVVRRVVNRPDELAEVLSYYATVNKPNWKSLGGGQMKKLRGLSKQLQYGLADAFVKFDEYQLDKWNKSDHEIKLRDVLFLTHPKPADKEMQEMWDRLVTGELKKAYTWEATKSKAGQDKRDNKETWEELILSKKMGYMAVLRNLRNILEAKVSKETIEAALNFLCNEKAVRNSKQFPYRFYSAYKEIVKTPSEYSPMVLEALEKAALYSIYNVEGFSDNDRILVACDVSGSMDCTISAKSVITRASVGLLLGMLLAHRCARVITSVFGQNFKVVNFPKSTPLANTLQRERDNFGVGHSTNGHLALAWAMNAEESFDKVLLFTDCQLWHDESNYGGYHYNWGSALEDNRFMQELQRKGNTKFTRMSIAQLWNLYKPAQSPNAKIYMVDLSGYGNTPLRISSQERAYFVAGWNADIFNIINKIESGSDALKEIKSIAL